MSRLILGLVALLVLAASTLACADSAIDRLIEQTGVRAHFCRLSTARAVRMVARARYDGLPVTAEFLIETILADLGADAARPAAGAAS